MELVMQVMQFFVIALVLVIIQGSASAAGYNVSPSPATFTEVPPTEVGRPSYHGKSLRSNGPTPESQPNGSVSHPPIALPPLKSASVPQAVEGFAPSFMPSTPTNTTLPPYSSAPPPSIIQRIAPLLPPRTPQINSSHVMAPGSVSHPPTVLPPLKSAPVPEAVKGSVPSLLPSTPITSSPPYSLAPPPSIVQRTAPLLPRWAPQINPSHAMAPGSVSHPPIVLPPLKFTPVPEAVKEPVPSFLPSTPTSSPPCGSAPPPSIVQRTAPLLPRWAPQINSSHVMAPVPSASPLKELPVSSPTAHSVMPGSLPPSSHQEKAPINRVPVVSVPVSSPPKRLEQNPPAIPPVMFEAPPPILLVPLASPPVTLPKTPPALHPVMPGEPPSTLPDTAVSPISAPPSSVNGKRYAMPVATSPNKMPSPLPPHPPSKDTAVSPISVPPSSVNGKRYAMPVAAPPNKFPSPLSPHPPSKDTAVSPISAPPSSGNGKRYAMPVAAPPNKFPSPLSPHPPSKDTAVSPISAPPSSGNGKRYAMPVAAPPYTFPSPLSPHPPSKDTAVSPISAPPSSGNGKRYAMPVAAPPYTFPSPLSQHPPSKDTAVSPISAPPSSVNGKRYAMPVAAPPNKFPSPLSPHPPSKDTAVSPVSARPSSVNGKRYAMPVAAPPNKMPSPLSPHPPSKDTAVSPISAPPSSVNGKRYAMPVAAPPDKMPSPLSPHPPSKGYFPVVPPSTHKASRHSNDAPAPAPLFYRKSSLKKWFRAPATSPSSSFHKKYHATNIMSPAPAASYLVPTHAPQQGPAMSLAPLHAPENLPRSRQRHRASPPVSEVSSASPSYSPLSSSANHVPPAPSPSPKAPSGGYKSVPILSPRISPSRSSPKNPKTPPPLPPALALPPPPPNEDCTSVVCTDPLTNTPPGSPCDCVWPMQVGLRLSVPLYTFFPLVSKLAEEIASGVFIKQSQVRIMGANAASQDPEKTVVLIDLVPLETKFDSTTAYLTYQRFWGKQIAIKASFFGDYEVLYVRYPGLPPSPPSAPLSFDSIDGGPNNSRTGKPLGVDVQRRQHKNGINGSVLAIIVLSASIAVVLCSAIAWILMFKCRDRVGKPSSAPQASLPSLARSAGIAGSMIGSGPSSEPLSFGSSVAPYTGSAKTFSSSEIEKATDNFDSSRIIGEGGFGLVYSGVLEDGTKVAVKILKRDDQQGGREFLAEVEMLSRLHHRNLVKLIGICTEEHNRCLVYELIPNGSVESHLHGVDSETSPLDWGTRTKIALGAARGLAYLHEDSSPRVIHRDFKSSNILLELDFTPKVSDFGLARTAMDEENRHISTRVMGTFGYVAPEYAMTGHLLVKSDVYSYGVVLLELLTGRKPVDMSQPPGEENLVAWARPLLTSKEGLQSMVDQSLGSNISFDSVAKVAAIASMCVQPEVSHRPFMGEVVQALKLVCNECDETKELGSRRSCSQEDLSIDLDSKNDAADSFQLPNTSHSRYIASNYDCYLDVERGLSASESFDVSGRSERQESGTLRRISSSGPLRRTGRGRHFWQRIGRLSRGSMSEHGVAFSLWPGSH